MGEFRVLFEALGMDLHHQSSKAYPNDASVSAIDRSYAEPTISAEHSLKWYNSPDLEPDPGSLAKLFAKAVYEVLEICQAELLSSVHHAVALASKITIEELIPGISGTLRLLSARSFGWHSGSPRSSVRRQGGRLGNMWVL